MNTSPAAASSKVLLIDSNVFFAKRLAESLMRQGVEVMHTTQSAYALTALEYQAPDAIICATNMREMGAFELLPILHEDEKASHIPVLAIGDGGEQTLMAAFRAGCADYLDRHAGPEHLASHVRSFLRSQRDGFQPTQMVSGREAALSGNLSHLDLPGVVQVLEQQRLSGALYVNSDDLDGMLFFDAGTIAHAECGELVGDDAVIEVVRRCQGAQSGVYKFVPGSLDATRTVMQSPTNLMLEALRIFDEANAEREL